MENICIIGGSGFIGTRLIGLLKQDSNYSLLNIDKKDSLFYPEITTVADVREKNRLEELLKGQDIVILLAAEHRDDVAPVSLYYDVNVEGTLNVLHAMEKCGVKKIIFTSSVAVYGLNKNNPNEEHSTDPFNHYGKTKFQAEEHLRAWYRNESDQKMLTIIRPTVVFGERNRGNVYNLLKQIASGLFLKIGHCNNKKSMAYVENIVNFMQYTIESKQTGYCLYNYADKPDLTTNELIDVVGKSLGRKIPSIKLPYWLGMFGGYCFDLLSKITSKKLSISSVRVKKFCATTQFDASKVRDLGFSAPYTLSEGLERTIKFEFLHEKVDDITFISE
ncbi:MAG: NAD-dependent epimerase/dehydratase family protein [Bacteroidales bacterium]|jgi:nucleoside-diphosphate-sugar epimerase|nr:NAD-dependent epimerase/dehydratase family protein [Bacteroidales bacterium]